MYEAVSETKNDRFPLYYHCDDELCYSRHPWIHWHEELEILCCEQGRANITCGTFHFSLEAGEVAVINPYTPHTLYAPEGCARHCLLIGQSLLREIGCTAVTFPSHIRDPELNGLLSRIRDEERRKEPYYRHQMLALATGLLVQLCRHHAEDTGTEPGSDAHHKTAVKIMSYIDQRIPQAVGIDDICRDLGYSRSYLFHIFKSVTGSTPLAYITGKRLQYADNLLTSGRYSIKECAYMSGFQTVGYFTRLYKKAFGCTPSCKAAAHTSVRRDPAMFDYYRPEDENLDRLLPHAAFAPSIDFSVIPPVSVPSFPVTLPSEEFEFLHEAAIIEYHGKLFASWYNNPSCELNGYTPIRGSESSDGGRTWSTPRILEHDPTEKILFCPPVYGVDDDTLYMFMNEMVGPDRMHALNLYIYREDRDAFEKLWSRPIPFKLNTNAVRLQNGKLILPGRVGARDSTPTTPAVLISDSGRIDAEWRLVKMTDGPVLPDGALYEYPEQTVIADGDTLWMFCRNDKRLVPIVFRSDDSGETWSGPIAIDIPLVTSKTYAGTLSDGRHYLIGNLYSGSSIYERDWLVLLLTEPGRMEFTKRITLQYRESETLGFGRDQWSYPAACEADGKLYVIYTAATVPGNGRIRGAVLSIVDLSDI